MSIFLLPLAISSMISSGLISITRLWIEINARPVNLSSPIVFLKYVFTRFKVEKLLSLVAVVIGSVAKILRIRNTAGIKSSLHSANESIVVSGTDTHFSKFSVQICSQILAVLRSQHYQKAKEISLVPSRLSAYPDSFLLHDLE